SMATELPPPRRQLGRAWVIDFEELGAERLGPERKHAVNAVAGHARTEQARLREPAPWHFARSAVACRREPEAAVSTELLGNAVGAHRVEKSRRLAVRGRGR